VDYKNIIDAYDKCNNIAAIARSAVIFPWTTFAIYMFLLILCLGAIWLIMDEYNVQECIHDLMILKDRKNYEKDKGDALPIHDHDREHLEDNYKKMKDIVNKVAYKKALMYFIGIVFVIVIAVLVITGFELETRSYISNLYSGDKYENKQCDG
jgi:uncharacterized protein YacL